MPFICKSVRKREISHVLVYSSIIAEDVLGGIEVGSRELHLGVPSRWQKLSSWSCHLLPPRVSLAGGWNRERGWDSRPFIPAWWWLHHLSKHLSSVIHKALADVNGMLSYSFIIAILISALGLFIFSDFQSHPQISFPVLLFSSNRPVSLSYSLTFAWSELIFS